jgi:hypothetical protein
MRFLPLVALAAVPLLGATARAQELPVADPPSLLGSPAHLALTPRLSAGGGTLSSLQFTAAATVAGPLGFGYSAASAQYSLVGAAAAAPADELASQGPLIAAVEPRIVHHAGAAVRVFGAGFSGGGLPSVTFAGQPATGVQVLSDRELSATSPLLVNAVGNPLGPVDVAVGSALGDHAFREAAVAAPGYVQTSPARLGSTFTVTHMGQPGSVGIPSWGKEVPGLFVPILPFDGVIELPQIFITYPAQLYDATGVAPTVYPIPDNPNLVGLTLTVQSLEVTSFEPLAGGFTNVVHIEVLP